MPSGPGAKNLGFGKPAAVLNKDSSKSMPNGPGESRIPSPPMGRPGDRDPAMKRVPGSS